jgi:hypothetical protein
VVGARRAREGRNSERGNAPVTDIAARGAPEADASRMIERASHAAPSAVEHVRIDHRSRDVAVSKKLLDRADVVAEIQEVRRERVPEGVAHRRLGEARGTDGIPE